MNTENNVLSELHDQLLREIQLSQSIGKDLKILLVSGGTKAADSPSFSMIANASGRPMGMLFISAAINPALMERAMTKAQDAKEVLGPDLGSVILQPLAHGNFRGLSFVMWPWRQEISSFFLTRYFQRRFLRYRVLSWILDVAKCTRRPVDHSGIKIDYERTLEWVSKYTEFPPVIRDMACREMDSLVSGTWRPQSALYIAT
jgi:hypothetical protein